MKNFHELFIKELKDIYNAEQQIVKALPDFVHAAHSPKLKEAFRHHLEETHKHVERLETIAAELNLDLKGVECEAMTGLLKQAHKMAKANYASDVKDAALIGEAQRIEHYEIAVYGTLKTYAKILKLDHVEKLLKETLKEESHADTKLTGVAEGGLFSEGVNTKACKKCA